MSAGAPPRADDTLARVFAQLDKATEAREREHTQAVEALKLAVGVLERSSNANDALQAHREKDIEDKGKIRADIANLQLALKPLLTAHSEGRVSKSELSWKLWGVVIVGALGGLSGLAVIVWALVKGATGG